MMAANVGTVNITLHSDELGLAFYALLGAVRIVLKEATWDGAPQGMLLLSEHGDIRLALECAVAMAETAIKNADEAKRNYRHPLLKDVRKDAEERTR